MRNIRVLPSDFGFESALDGYRLPEFLDLQTQVDVRHLMEDLPTLGLAVVGTRNPQRRSLELLETVLSGLQGTRIIIVSGLARGVDACAHELALKFGLRTLAILGCGIDLEYPRANKELRRKIIAGGGIIVSPFAPGTPPIPRNFHERNGLIAGLARATWVVEAAAISGTLNTAAWANRLNRHLYATPAFPGDPFYQGNEKLLSQRQSDRYPPAEALYGTHSLGSTWPDLARGTLQNELPLHQGLTEIQRWVLEISHQFGECQVQALLNLAMKNGQTLGSFYLRLEAELSEGSLRQEPDGRIEVTFQRK